MFNKIAICVTETFDSPPPFLSLSLSLSFSHPLLSWWWSLMKEWGWGWGGLFFIFTYHWAPVCLVPLLSLSHTSFEKSSTCRVRYTTHHWQPYEINRFNYLAIQKNPTIDLLSQGQFSHVRYLLCRDATPFNIWSCSFNASASENLGAGLFIWYCGWKYVAATTL